MAAVCHTQTHCNKKPTCVNCAVKRATIECKTKRFEKAKCVHCGESHAANYQGCIVAKEPLKRRKQILHEQKRGIQKSTTGQKNQLDSFSRD
ncbi:hypothetical protein WH47_02421 [Habropoda laboriosa]|uniref:Nucleic-acid-binding protein from transposon X-element n=1 Tax=Habropoda laboriosa TaxID=597456 RepID=A0A0L7RKW2_9HYME|nr:hypothetical protein WH47_02421 [Habropoda laboriosa]